MIYKKYFLFAFITLLIGGFIYICFRNESIIFLTGLRNLNINYSLFRQINIGNNFISRYIIYNLPNGLWVLSGLLFLKTFLTDKNILNIYSIIYIGVCLLYEISQYFKIIPGTFDILDIITIIIFSSIGIKINLLGRKHEKA